ISVREDITIQTTAIVTTDDWSDLTKELLDSLPQVWTRGLLYFLAIFVAIILPWAMLSKVDETGTARGRLEPKGKTFKLDAPVVGTVADIKVKEGESVKAGQSLVELESELVIRELQQQQEKLSGQQNRLALLDLLKNQSITAIRTQEQQNQAQDLEKQAQIQQAQQNLKSLRISYFLQKEEKQAQVNQAKQDLDKNKIAYKLAEIALKGSQEKYQRYQQALESNVISQDRFQEVEQLVKENSERLMQSKSDIVQAQSRLNEQQSSYQRIIEQAQAEIAQAQLKLQEQQRNSQSLAYSGRLALLKSQDELKNLETEMTTLTAEIAQSQSQIQSLQFQLTQRVIKTPIEGIVFQLPVKNAGDVLQAGDLIAEIAPKGSLLVLRSQMDTTESGSLRVGMPVKMKFDAYPFQDYGVVEGKLNQIAPTSKVTDTTQGQVTTYDLEIELKQTCIPTPDRCIALKPGQTATAEVIVRQRRIIDFLLDPFKQLQKGGLKL
nr:HlyD family secretion protein [Hydrococcus sp. Prado102]